MGHTKLFDDTRSANHFDLIVSRIGRFNVDRLECRCCLDPEGVVTPFANQRHVLGIAGRDGNEAVDFDEVANTARRDGEVVVTSRPKLNQSIFRAVHAIDIQCRIQAHILVIDRQEVGQPDRTFVRDLTQCSNEGVGRPADDTISNHV